MGCGDDYFDFASTKVHNLVQLLSLLSHMYMSVHGLVWLQERIPKTNISKKTLVCVLKI